MRMQILDLTKLSTSAKDRLERLYDELSEFEWPSIINQYTSPPKERKRLDLEILKSFGVSDEHEAERIIQLIYDSITKALRAMQTTMEAD